MKPTDKCSSTKCGKELKFGVEKIIQTSERGISGIYHKDCYDEVKLEKLSNESF